MTGAGGTSMEPELVSILRPTVSKLREQAQCARKGTPWTCGVWSLCTGPQSEDPGGTTIGQLHPKGDGPSGFKALRSHLVSVSPGAGVPTPSIFDSTLITGFL